MQFRVVGPDPDKVRAIAYQVRDVVRAEPERPRPQLDWNEQTPSIRLEVDQDRARALGPRPAGRVADPADADLRPAGDRQSATGPRWSTWWPARCRTSGWTSARIQDLTIVSRNGVAGAAGAGGAASSSTHEEPILWRRNRDMSITVRADVVDGVQPPDVTNQIWPELARIRAALPAGYRIEIGGAIEEIEKANASLFAVFPVMLAVMLTLLMIQLQSFSRLLLVFAHRAARHHRRVARRSTFPTRRSGSSPCSA